METQNQTDTMPIIWFSQKYPDVAKEYGKALDLTLKGTGFIVKGINENFFAAILGSLGNPVSPIVYATIEDRFYGYDETEGIYVVKSKQEIVFRLSKIMQQCADDCKNKFFGMSYDAEPLVFYFSKAAQLSGFVEKAKGMLAVKENFFETNLEEYIVCKNGTLRLSDRTLLPFDPKYRRRNKLAVNYDSDAKCADFMEKLLKPALTEVDINLLKQWCGLCLTGVNLSQVIVLLNGTAGGGKGTFIRVLHGIIGQHNVEQLRTEQLGGRFETAEYIGKILLYGADVKATFLNNASASYLKSLTGGDPLNAEIKGVTGRPVIYGKYLVIVTSNSRLKVNLEGDADAYRRRLIVIELNKAKPDSVIVNFSEQLLENEASGILNWMLDGLDILKRQGYVIELSIEQKRVVDDLLLESESPNIFVKECLVRDESSILTTSDCFNTYSTYCKNRKWLPLDSRDASKLITQAIAVEFGLSQRNDIRGSNGKDQRGWKGIKVK